MACNKKIRHKIEASGIIDHSQTVQDPLEQIMILKSAVALAVAVHLRS
jgi:hypothetical protein